MLEARITIDAPELANAINNLAAAISGGQAVTNVNVQTAPPTKMQAPSQMPAPQPSAPAPAPAATVPLAQPPKYTVAQIMAAGATLMDAGKVNELINLLHSFGVQAVRDLKPEQRGEFATARRGLGAKI